MTKALDLSVTMASIDRYRPSREGYQPPTIVGVSRHEQPSRSPPPRRREVPPAAPTPPQHSTRTSPPRQQQQQSQQSQQQQQQQQSPSQSGEEPPQAQSSQQRTPLAALGQWFFTSKEIHSTPTIVDGVAPQEERLRRAKGVNFIYQAGVMLDLPQITLWVAGVFFHRFFMRFSMVQEKGGIHHYNIAATALFLANKVEENCRKTKEIIIAVARVAQKNARLAIDEQSKEYWRWRDSILTYEEVMLEQLTFDLMVDNPYRHLYELLGALEVVHNKNLRQAAWAFCNDACLTTLPLLMEARDVAITSIFFASAHTDQQISDVQGQAWWRFLRGSEDRCSRAIEVMRQFYAENPLRKQNPSLPSPAFHLENTRRGADYSGDALSFHLGSPMDVDRDRDRDRDHDRDRERERDRDRDRDRDWDRDRDRDRNRGSRSPAATAATAAVAKVNGSTFEKHNTDGPAAGSGSGGDVTLRSNYGDSNESKGSPKRKGQDDDASAGSDREQKRARLSEDEGELVED